MFARAWPLAVGLVVIGGESLADVAFSTIGPTLSGHYQWPDALSLESRLGWAFTPTRSGQVAQMRTQVVTTVAGGVPVRIEVYNDSGGLPGDLLGAAAGLAPYAPGSVAGIYPAFVPDSPIHLAAGETYYFVLKREAMQQVRWYINAPFIRGRQVSFGEFNQGPTNLWESTLPGQDLIMTALEVTVTVPAPGAGIAVVSGAGVFVCGSRRRRNR